MAKKKGLGKGLEALLGGSPLNKAESNKVVGLASQATSVPKPMQTSEADASHQAKVTLQTTSVSSDQVVSLDINMLQAGRYQPRRAFDNETLEELAASIEKQGVIQPIVVRKLQTSKEEKYEILAGERRWRACKLLNRDSIPAIVREMSDDDAIAVALIENLQREDLNPMDEAYALLRLQKEFDLSHQQIADAVGKSRTAVSNALRLMGLQKDVKIMLENGDIDMGHARALLSLDLNRQLQTAQTVSNKSLTVRDTEALVKSLLSPKKKKPVKTANSSADANIQRLQNDLSEKLGCAVMIQHGNRGNGKVILSYSSLDELDGILAHME